MIMTERKNPDFALLLVDDEKPWLNSISRSLKSLGKFNNLILCSDSRQVLPLLGEHDIGVVILDLVMPDIGGEVLLEQIRKEHPHILIIILSGMNQVDTAVRCIRTGAYDYFVKTTEEDRLIDGIKRAVELAELQRENRRLRHNFFAEGLTRDEVFAPIVTQNAAMKSVFRYLESVSSSRHPILILGESGVGKELIAKAIHQLCEANGPLVSVNVAGLDASVFSDTLFGHVRGAFTGADKERPGLIEQAAGGTLFLDEIGDLPIPNQIKLLRLIQEGEFLPLGSDRPKKLEAKILCATHQDLDARVEEEKFRRDLYFRLQTHQVTIPPLRERRDDLPILLDHFLDQAAAEMEKKKPAVPRELPALLACHHFPGNVRELRSMVFDAMSLHGKGVLSMATFRKRIQAKKVPLPEKREDNPFRHLEELPTLKEADTFLVEAALERAGGNQTIAAGILGIAQPSLSKRLKRRKRKK